MTETIAPPQTPAEPPPTLQRPATDEAALRSIEDAADHQHPAAAQPAAG